MSIIVISTLYKNIAINIYIIVKVIFKNIDKELSKSIPKIIFNNLINDKGFTKAVTLSFEAFRSLPRCCIIQP